MKLFQLSSKKFHRRNFQFSLLTFRPVGDPNKPLKMFLFDSWFDRYRGVICLVRIIDGTIRKGDVITSAHSKQAYEILELGILFPGQVPTDAL